MSRISEVIQKKRDGKSLADFEIREFIAGVTSGAVPDYQAAALLMAVFFNGLSEAELDVWADAMLRSGEVLDLSSVPGVKVDKHSTGGVGDKVSISLAPLVAAAGVPVPMISGRGLGHTGGTLDKLEAIPGFRVDLDVARFIDQVRCVGTAMIGQTAELAPADRKLYALRDVTATVESIPLIAASIMSKKLAAGIDGLVLDVKVGRGAFMKQLPRARELALTLARIGERAGKRVWAVLTSMDQPLGLTIGNALETIEAIDVLRGGGHADLVEVTLELGARMLVLGGVATGLDDARATLLDRIRSGAALETFRAMVEAQGGDARVADDPGVFPRASVLRSVTARASGFVRGIDAEALGLAGMRLGAGRARAEDRVDPAVGIVLRRKVGDRVEAGEELAVLHANGDGDAAAVVDSVVGAYEIGGEAPEPIRLLLDEIRPNPALE
jgi:pyrimidine-nucleoside phosphorylase/thymidine phosphorylase